MNIKNLFSTKKYQKNISVSEAKERYLILGCFPKLYNLKYDNGSGLSPTVTICNQKSDLEKIFMSLHTWQHNMVMEKKALGAAYILIFPEVNAIIQTIKNPNFLLTLLKVTLGTGMIFVKQKNLNVLLTVT